MTEDRIPCFGGTLPAEGDRPHPFHMSSYGTEPRCWCGRYYAATVHISAEESGGDDE